MCFDVILCPPPPPLFLVPDTRLGAWEDEGGGGQGEASVGAQSIPLPGVPLPVRCAEGGQGRAPCQSAHTSRLARSDVARSTRRQGGGGAAGRRGDAGVASDARLARGCLSMVPRKKKKKIEMDNKIK